MPNWATQARQAKLVELWATYGNKCLLGHSVCDNPEHYIHLKPIRLTCGDWIKVPEVKRLYDLKESEVISDWVKDDRESKAYLNRIISRMLHRIPEVGSLRGRFNAISRDIFHDSQPQYYIESLGISGLTFKPFAKVRIASGYTRLFIDLKAPLASLSKNKRRKYLRYGKGIPLPVQREVEASCNRAIAHYLSK